MVLSTDLIKEGWVCCDYALKDNKKWEIILNDQVLRITEPSSQLFSKKLHIEYVDQCNISYIKDLSGDNQPMLFII